MGFINGFLKPHLYQSRILIHISYPFRPEVKRRYPLNIPFMEEEEKQTHLTANLVGFVYNE